MRKKDKKSKVFFQKNSQLFNYFPKEILPLFRKTANMTNGDLAHELVLQLLKTRMSFRQAIQRVLKQSNTGMTFEMLQIMHRLWTTQGVSQQYLAEKTAKDKACLTNLINNLEKKGWVVRQEDPNDRRNRLVYLTHEGEALAGRVKPLLKNIYEQTGRKMNTKQMQACMNQLITLNDLFENI